MEIWEAVNSAAFEDPRFMTRMIEWKGGLAVAALLEIRDLEISFRHGKRLVPAVSGASFSVQPKEIVSLVGESGSG